MNPEDTSMVEDPLRAYDSYAALLSHFLEKDFQTPAVNQMVRFLLEHETASLSEISQTVADSCVLKTTTTRGKNSIGCAITLPGGNSSSSTSALTESARESIRTAAITRELLTRLLAHRVIASHSVDGLLASSSLSSSAAPPVVYALQTGTALLLRVYYPLLLHYVQQRYGTLGRRVALMVHQLGVASVEMVVSSLAEAAVRAGESVPCTPHKHLPSGGGGGRNATEDGLSPPPARWIAALRRTVDQLLHDGVLELVGKTKAMMMMTTTTTTSGWWSSSSSSDRRVEKSSPAGACGGWCVRWNVTHMVRLLQHAAMRQMVLERVSGPAALRRAAGVVLDCLCRAQEEVWLSQSSSHPLLHSYKAETVKRERDDAQSLGLGADEIGASSPSPSSSSLGSALARQGGGGGGGGIGRPATLQQTMKNGFPPPLPRQASATVSREGIVASCLAVMRDSVPNEGAAAAVGLVADVLRQLQDSAMGQTGLLGEGGAGMGRGGFMFPSGGGDAYALSYAPLLAAVLDVVVEKVVFARHGVLGTRVFHLLRRHHFLEDRTIAEHLIAPQPRTREVLHEMLRDGLLQQKEISKEDVNMTAERNPKKQVYLWGVQESSQLRPTVRQRVATALLHALQRLAATREQHSEISPIVARAASSAAAAVATSNDDLMTKRVKREVSEEEEVRGQGTVHEGVPWNREKVQGGPSDADVAVMNAYRQVVGLEHVVLAHMRLLFVLDYFY